MVQTAQQQPVTFEEISPNNPEYLQANPTDPAQTSPQVPTEEPQSQTVINTTQQSSQSESPLFSAEDIARLSQQGNALITQNATNPPPELTTDNTNTEGANASVKITGEPTTLDYIVDTLTGISAGPQKAVNEALDMTWAAGNFVKEGVTQGWHNAQFREPSPEEQASLPRFRPWEAQLLPGKIAQGITQFLTGFKGAGMLLKSAKVLQGAETVVTASRLEAQSMLSDFMSFDAHEERMGNLFDNVCGLRDSWLAYSAARPDDSAAEGRFKNMLEGAGLGVAASSLMRGFRFMKESMLAGSEKEQAALLEKYIDDVLEEETVQTAKEAEPIPVDMPLEKMWDGTEPVKGADLNAVRGETKAHGQSTGDATDLPVVRGEASPVSVADEGKPTTELTRREETSLSETEGWEGGRNATGKREKKATLQVGEENISTNPYDYPVSMQGMSKLIKRSESAAEAVQEITSSANLRREVFDTPQASNMIRTLGEQLADKTLKAVGKQSQHEVYKQAILDAKELGTDFTRVMSNQVKNIQDLERIARESLIAKNMYHIMCNEVTRLAKNMESGTASSVDTVRYAMLVKNIESLHVANADMRTAMGRNLSLGKFTTTNSTAEGMFNATGAQFSSKWLDLTTIADDIEAEKWLNANGMSVEDIRKSAKQTVATEGNIASQVKNITAHKTWGTYLKDVASEFYINNILYSPVTHGFNFLGNTLKVLDAPSSRMVGAVMRHDMEGIRQAKNEFAGLWMFMNESMRFISKAWKLNNNILMQDHAVIESGRNSISASSLRDVILREAPAGSTLSDTSEFLLSAFDYFGKAVNVPGRALMATDEAFKQLTFRSSMYAELCEEAYQKGITGGDAVGRYAKEEMAKYMTPEGRALRNKKTENSLRLAQEATWTQNLGKSGQLIQQLANHNLGVRMIIPFIRTPTNILKDFIAHTPAIYLNRVFGDDKWKERYAKDMMFRNEVHGKVASGSLMAAMGVGMAFSGRITGSAPVNDKERRAWERAGFQEYSIKVGDRWYSYRRVDPFGMFLGICADLVNMTKDKGSWEELEDMKWYTNLAAVAVNNLTSKTYMQGFSDFVNMMNDPERYGNNYFGRFTSNFIPFANGLREVRKNTDPVRREMESFMDYFRNTVPGASSALPARMNWVTGQPTEYTYIPKQEKDIVFDELYRLADGIMGEPSSIVNGVRLNKEQLSRYKELHGTEKLGGKTMYEQLLGLFSASDYDIRRERIGDAPALEKGPRERMVNSIIKIYRDNAIYKLRNEYPELDRQMMENIMLSQGSKSGAITKENQKEQIDNLLNK